MTVVYFRFKSPLELIIILIKSERKLSIVKRLHDDSNQQQNLLRDLLSTLFKSTKFVVNLTFL